MSSGSMGRRRMKNGLEQDAFKARSMYCYLRNNYSLVAFAKRAQNKRDRQEGRNEARNWERGGEQ